MKTKKQDTKEYFIKAFTNQERNSISMLPKGTNPTSGDDWKNNLQQAISGNSPQYKQSISIAKDLVQYYEGISFTGHSLGGGLASANALAVEGKAVTFNAAGLSKITKSNNNLLGNTAKITAYVVQGEIVSHLQGKIGLKAEGKIITLPASYIMKIPYTTLDDKIRTGQRISNHLMGPVMEKFKESKRY